MDEDSIVSALQADLQNYKVKTQIRRKESQLHVLISRAEGDDLDYASLYDIVKRRIDKLPVEGVDSLVVYGRIAGAKHPEWQKQADIAPPLPLIELDLDELEDFGEIGEIGNLAYPVNGDETEIQIASFEPDTSGDLDGFEKSIDRDLRAASLTHNSDEISKSRIDDFDLKDLDLGEFKLDSLNQSNFELDNVVPKTLELNDQPLNNQSPTGQDKNNWLEDDLGSIDQTTLAIPMPLPPPPLPPTRRSPSVVVSDNDSEPKPEPKKTAYPSNKSLLLSSAFVVVAIAILGICGWLVWDRSVQQKYLADARSFDDQNLNPKTITKLDSLTETRNQLQTKISRLEEIPDRPASLYTEAQTELTSLRPKLEEFDRKVNIEQVANKKLEEAKNITNDAAKLVQNPPHRSTVWKSAQEKRQQAIKLLEEVPTDSLLYANAQSLLKTYRADSVQISKWVEIQQRAEASASNVNPDIASKLKQLKSKVPEKQKFLPQCKIILQPQISNVEGQRAGLPAVTLTEYLCAYFWDS